MSAVTPTVISLSRMLICRGEILRDHLDLSLLGAKQVENQGQNWVVTIGVAFGKTKKGHEKTKEVGFFRHKDVFQCPMFYLGYMFIVKYRILKAPFPDLSQPSNWYQQKLISVLHDNSRAISYNMHLKAITKLYGEHDITMRVNLNRIFSCYLTWQNQL
jgi:hypothetical protein